MQGYLNKRIFLENLEKYLKKRGVLLAEVVEKIKTNVKCNVAYLGGSIVYGINNIYSDIDILAVVDDSYSHLPAQLTQFEIKGVRVDCRTISTNKLKSVIDNIQKKADIIADNKNPFRIGLRNDEHEALDRISNGICLHGNEFKYKNYDDSLSLILTFDRINDFFGIYQDTVGALLSGHRYYAYTRINECAAKLVDIFLSSKNYINPSVKSRVLVLERFYPNDSITLWYKSILENISILKTSDDEMRNHLRKMNSMIIDLQLEKLKMIERYHG
ncbi:MULTISPECIES: nucleotidyltransferase domain-containing protein [Pectobacterium]|uniref:DNA polymerase beta domain protein region n=1 Tax=Pectobacterium carotovorum subsp. carotovorum (strain PC1) TaxID=561230 RepID=C6DAU4_PECCP|nr:nucleotidyltransferase domain-containing protein [Pectobacterium carotovorum]ACT13928.1 DNA polymerase beta domain protein region [Pectobacterium carotovorum subsp. carotovorum PC1]